MLLHGDGLNKTSVDFGSFSKFFIVCAYIGLKYMFNCAYRQHWFRGSDARSGHEHNAHVFCKYIFLGLREPYSGFFHKFEKYFCKRFDLSILYGGVECIHKQSTSQ